MNTPLPQKNRSATVQRITTAARQVFYEKGFFIATVDEIARKGEISRATIYLHFKTKDEILFALLEEDLAYQLTQYESLAAIKRVSISAVRKWLLSFGKYIADQRNSLSLFWSAAALRSSGGGMAVGHRDRVIALLGHRFPGFDLDALNRQDRKVLRARCHIMIYLVEGISMNAHESEGMDLGTAVDEVAPILLEFLRTGRFVQDTGSGAKADDDMPCPSSEHSALSPKGGTDRPAC